MIHIREEGDPIKNGIELFRYYGEKRISGIILRLGKYRFGMRWNRPQQLPPKFYFS